MAGWGVSLYTFHLSNPKKYLATARWKDSLCSSCCSARLLSFHSQETRSVGHGMELCKCVSNNSRRLEASLYCCRLLDLPPRLRCIVVRYPLTPMHSYKVEWAQSRYSPFAAYGLYYGFGVSIAYLRGFRHPQNISQYSSSSRKKER